VQPSATGGRLPGATGSRHQENLKDLKELPLAATVLGRATKWIATNAVLHLTASQGFLVIGSAPLLLIIGVVYPAVWSRDAERRAAALTVLKQLLRLKR
jgi:hypothetical protein